MSDSDDADADEEDNFPLIPTENQDEEGFDLDEFIWGWNLGFTTIRKLKCTRSVLFFTPLCSWRRTSEKYWCWNQWMEIFQTLHQLRVLSQHRALKDWNEIKYQSYWNLTNSTKEVSAMWRLIMKSLTKLHWMLLSRFCMSMVFVEATTIVHIELPQLPVNWNSITVWCILYIFLFSCQVKYSYKMICICERCVSRLYTEYVHHTKNVIFVYTSCPNEQLQGTFTLCSHIALF